MAEKLINNGSETKTSRCNIIALCIGAVLMIIGLGLLAVKALSGEYIDTSGILHENFFLVPIGFLFLLCGVILFLITGIINLVSLIKNKDGSGEKSRIITLAISAGVVILFAVFFILLVISNS